MPRVTTRVISGTQNLSLTVCPPTLLIMAKNKINEQRMGRSLGSSPMYALAIHTNSDFIARRNILKFGRGVEASRKHRLPF